LEYESPVEALVTAALETVALMESLDFTNFKVSMKSTSVPNTIASNRLLAEKVPYPLHLGVTEAGTKWSGSLKSAVGLGTLLADGIGDTIRISLSTFHAEEEVKVAWEILKALKLREKGPVLIACPTCGRLQFDMDTVVAEVEARLEQYEDPIEVSVLGCAVNGIGEARHADFGITGAKDMGMIYSKGEPLKKVPTEQLVDELFKEIDRYYAAGKTVTRDEREAAEAREWLAANEDATAMTPEKLAALEAAAVEHEAEADAVLESMLEPAGASSGSRVALDEQVSPVAGRRFSRS
jgi:(E)-4-hydroxy-3-methylbut-2-enyl-diphosphate synthase